MFPEYISRNIVLSIILTIVIIGVGSLASYLFVEIHYYRFIPSSAGWLDNFQILNPKTSFIICLTITLLVAMIWNTNLNNTEVLLKEEFLQLVNIVLLSSLIYSSIPSIQLALSLFFISLAISRLFTINRNTDTFHSVSFDAGLFIGIATYFNFTSIVFLLFAWGSMFILSSIRIKEFIWNLIGFAFPFLVLWMINFIFNTNVELFPIIYLGDLSIAISLNWPDLLLMGICAIIIFYGLLILNHKLRRSSVRFQRLISAMNLLFLFMAIFGLILGLINDWKLIYISLLLPIGYFWHCIGHSRTGLLLKSLLYILWVGVILFNFLSFSS